MPQMKNISWFILFLGMWGFMNINFFNYNEKMTITKEYSMKSESNKWV